MNKLSHENCSIFTNVTFDSLFALLPNILSREIDMFLGIPGILDTYNILDDFEKELSRYLNESIFLKANWVNVLKYNELDNEFPWHKDDQYGGQFVGIYWLLGEPGKGGDLSLLIEGVEQRISFYPGKLIVFPSSFLHKVHPYMGTQPRIAFNFTFSLPL